MQQIKASLKMIRMSPRKVGLVADVIRRKNISDALISLSHINKFAAMPLKKLLNSAIANARNFENVAVDKLFIKEILVGRGSILKRFQHRSKGRAYPILKYTSCVFITLEEWKTPEEYQQIKLASKSTIKPVDVSVINPAEPKITSLPASNKN